MNTQIDNNKETNKNSHINPSPSLKNILGALPRELKFKCKVSWVWLAFLRVSFQDLSGSP